MAAEFDVLSDEKSKELNEKNEKAFYKKAELFGLDKTEAESYFRMICNDKVIQNDVAEFRGLVIDDFDQDGQKDIAIMVHAHNTHYYGTGYVYFYMNGDNPYRFYDEEEYDGGYGHNGRGISNWVGDAKFLIVWDEDGNSHFEKWWIEPHYDERG